MAETSLARGRQSEDPSDFLTAIVMTAFCLEAYLNFLGERVLPFWSKIDRIRVRNKLGVICSHLDFRPDFGIRPYQSLDDLWKFRNELAHARTETLSVVRDGLPPKRLSFSETRWESQRTLVTAERLLDDTKEVIRDLHTRSGLSTGTLGMLAIQGGEIL